MSIVIGETDFRRSAQERFREAGILLRQEYFAGSVYLAGRAVESMLRALLIRNDPDLRTGRKSLETGHDLRLMMARLRELGVIHDLQQRTALANGIQFIGRLWFNNMRFVHTKKLQSIWRERGEIHKKRSLKTAVSAYYDNCSVVMKYCEVLYAKA